MFNCFTLLMLLMFVLLQGESKKESRKQEYLRKMGLSQEGNDDVKVDLRRQASVSSEKDTKVDDRNSKDSLKEERSRLSSRYRKQESKESDANDETKEKEKQEESKVRDRRETRQSTGSKTLDMISKLQVI